MKSQKGFTLIELIIIILVICIIVIIAIPNVIGSRRATYEAAAMSNLRVLHSGQYIYYRTTGGGHFTSNMNDLADAKIIDSALGSGSRTGYGYQMATDPTSKVSFTIGAIPSGSTNLTRTGTKKFCITPEGSIRFESNRSLLGTNISNDGDCNAVNYSRIIE